MKLELTAKQTRSFWEKTEKAGATECWEWSSCKNNGGYGQLAVTGRSESAHRVSWVIEHGEIPHSEGYHGTCVLHRCDNRSCVNPGHLFLGTQKDNMNDMDAKGRENRPKGIDHHRAVLTDEDVRRIRTIGKAVTGLALADEFGVHPSQISRILNRRSWSHI
jgi:hypothetical protein